MTIEGIFEDDEGFGARKLLYYGSSEECKEYASHLNTNHFDYILLCEDDGSLVEVLHRKYCLFEIL